MTPLQERKARAVGALANGAPVLLLVCRAGETVYDAMYRVADDAGLDVDFWGMRMCDFAQAVARVR